MSSDPIDRLHILPHIKDECLNHARRGVGDRHYSQYDYLAEQRSAFEAWANFIASLVENKRSKIVELRAMDDRNPQCSQERL